MKKKTIWPVKFHRLSFKSNGMGPLGLAGAMWQRMRLENDNKALHAAWLFPYSKVTRPDATACWATWESITTCETHWRVTWETLLRQIITLANPYATDEEWWRPRETTWETIVITWTLPCNPRAIPCDRWREQAKIVLQTVAGPL